MYSTCTNYESETGDTDTILVKSDSSSNISTSENVHQSRLKEMGLTTSKVEYYYPAFLHNIKITGFINIAHRDWIRVERSYEKWQLEVLWADTEEDRDRNIDYEDIFCLKKLFGLEPYDEIEEEELWLS